MESTEPVNPYAPPSTELDLAPSFRQIADLQGAREGRYEFRIGEVMDEAWRLVKGMKASFWGAAAVIGVFYLVIDTLVAVGLAMFVGDNPTAFVNSFVGSFRRSFVTVLMTPLTMGLQMMCVRRALGAPVSFSTAFSYLHRGRTAILGVGLVSLLTTIGTALLILPGIYLFVGYQLTTILICDQEMKVWRAMETSRRAIHHKWWQFLLVIMVAFLLLWVSALPLLIPLIWALPWYLMVYAVLYRRIFFAGPPPEIPEPYVSPPGPPPV